MTFPRPSSRALRGELNRRDFMRLTGGLIVSSALPGSALAEKVETVDVCVYAGTASGLMAAVAAKREGARVLIVEPSRWLGGMTGGGLMHIDWGRREAVGGTALGILGRDYNDAQYREVFAALVKEHELPVIYEHRLASVQREGTTIKSITLDHAPPDSLGCPAAEPKMREALRISARVFIDCSYEGDLMAKAGVTYTHGREARETYGESLAGVQEPMAVYPIDPYVKPGDPKSGLIPLLQEITMPAQGAADKLTMGYGFRWRFGKDPDGWPIEPPEDYDPRTFELYRRGFRARASIEVGRKMRKLGQFEPEVGTIHKFGAGNLSRALWAPTVWGHNADYPEADYATRARIWKEQQNFVRSLTHFIRTDPAVPAKDKELARVVTLTRGAFDETRGYPHQLYVREARRMKSDYVVTQKNLAAETDVDDSVGLASYGVDEWPYATHVLDGKVALQGGFFSMLYLEEPHRGIYKIPYRAITPRREECTNLLVPVCVSASHIAMTSIRMEPVWMILGESAGVAAAMAVKAETTVQEVSYPPLRTRLLELGQKLERPV